MTIPTVFFNHSCIRFSVFLPFSRSLRNGAVEPDDILLADCVLTLRDRAVRVMFISPSTFLDSLTVLRRPGKLGDASGPGQFGLENTAVFFSPDRRHLHVFDSEAGCLYIGTVSLDCDFFRMANASMCHSLKTPPAPLPGSFLPLLVFLFVNLLFLLVSSSVTCE